MGRNVLEEMWLSVEHALVSALNALQDGYGDYAACEDTRFDQLYLTDQERLRRLMEGWKCFREARQLVLDRCEAQRLASSLSG